MRGKKADARKRYESRVAVGSPVEQPVRPELRTAVYNALRAELLMGRGYLGDGVPPDVVANSLTYLDLKKVPMLGVKGVAEVVEWLMVHGHTLRGYSSAMEAMSHRERKKVQAAIDLLRGLGYVVHDPKA